MEGEREKQVVYGLAAAWSGSSLLNALLSTQPGIAALGEAGHLRNLDQTNAWCSRCQTPVQQCRLAQVADARRFFGSIFGEYPDASVLVDFSKHWSVALNGYVDEPQYRVQVIVLSKTPHEFAYSSLGHNPQQSFADALRDWFRLYEFLLERLDQFCAYTHHRVRRWPGPAIRPQDVLCVTYRQVVAEPARTVSRICQLLDTPFDASSLSDWTRPRNCIIGGNRAVYAQMAGNRGFFGSASDYLQGKYAGRYGQMFVDEQWRGEPSFARQCHAQYEGCRARLERLLPLLGQLSWDELLRDLGGPGNAVA